MSLEKEEKSHSFQVTSGSIQTNKIYIRKKQAYHHILYLPLEKPYKRRKTLYFLA